VLATYIFIVALRMLDPSIVAFLSQTQIVFVILLGFFFLGEVFNRSEIIAAFIIILGMILMTYKSGHVPPIAALLVIIANLLGAASLVIVRKIGPSVGTFTVTRLRTIVLFILFLGIKLMTEGKITVPPIHVLFVALLGAAFGPFLNTLSIYKALEYIPAGKLVLFRGVQPLPVMVFAALILNMFPGWRETVGGLVTISGCILLAYYHSRHYIGGKTPLRTIRG
jgi:drug/metabolite transporter (DMT)-like permease